MLPSQAVEIPATVCPKEPTTWRTRLNPVDWARASTGARMAKTRRETYARAFGRADGLVLADFGQRAAVFAADAASE